MRLPEAVRRAIRSGPTPKLRKFEKLPPDQWTRGERVIAFIEGFCRVPEGAKVGAPIVLELFQRAFILAIYDNPRGTRRAILSIARKNGKSALIACLLLAHLIGPEATRNSQIVSGAMTKSQASLVYKLAAKMIALSPQLQAVAHPVDSQKILNGLPMATEYKALAAEGAGALGLSPVLAILDETGAVRGPSNAFVDAITSSQGAHDNPLLVVISTQAPSDADLLSVWIDDASNSKDPHTVTHVYEAPESMALMDRKGWAIANPALGKFRNRTDLEEQLKRAQRVPALEASASNLLLNRRVSQEGLWLSPSVWKANAGQPDRDLFGGGRSVVAMGLDLAARQDLTAAVLAATDDDGVVHLLPYCFCPSEGVRERAHRDRAPYDVWIKQGHLHALGTKTMDYAQIVGFMNDTLHDLDCELASVEFDRWRIEDWQREADAQGFQPYAAANGVGQGYKDFSPRCENFLSLLLDGKVRHGGHPLLNMAAANAVAERDHTGSTRITKRLSTQRIDPLVAAIMGAYAVTEGGRVDGALLETLIG